MRLLRSLRTKHLRKALYPLDYVYRALRCSRPDLWIVSGQERSSSLPLSVVVGLPTEEKSYLLDMLFEEPRYERHLGRAWTWNISALAQAAGVEYSLLALPVEKPQFAVKNRRGFLVIPNWVSAEIKLPLDREVLRSTAVQSDLKKIRDHKLEFDIVREPSAFEKFYREMHLPYMTNVYGGAAFVTPYEHIKKDFLHCELLLVKKDGEYISGVILSLSPEGSHLWLLGVRNGDRAYLKVGALAAIYHFGLTYLQGKGYSKVDLGWSRCFLKDGALRYKRKMGMRISGSHARGIALRVVSFDPATRSFLKNNPTIVENAHGLCGTVFVDAETPTDEVAIKQLNKEYSYPGLAKLLISPLPPELPEQPVSEEASLNEHIEGGTREVGSEAR